MKSFNQLVKHSFKKIKEKFSSLRSDSKWVRFVLLLFVALSVPFTVYIAQKHQDIRQRAAEAPPPAPGLLSDDLLSCGCEINYDRNYWWKGGEMCNHLSSGPVTDGTKCVHDPQGENGCFCGPEAYPGGLIYHGKLCPAELLNQSCNPPMHLAQFNAKLAQSNPAPVASGQPGQPAVTAASAVPNPPASAQPAGSNCGDKIKFVIVAGPYSGAEKQTEICSEIPVPTPGTAFNKTVTENTTGSTPTDTQAFPCGATDANGKKTQPGIGEAAESCSNGVYVTEYIFGTDKDNQKVSSGVDTKNGGQAWCDLNCVVTGATITPSTTTAGTPPSAANSTRGEVGTCTNGVEPNLANHPPGYKFLPICSGNSCKTAADCPKNYSIPDKQYIDHSSWCYGYAGPKQNTDDWRCLQLQKQ